MKNNANPKKHILVILGATATGKSDLAVKIAKKINGEIISADSRQVYQFMDIGTGKITDKEKMGIPHYMLDIIHPKKVFSVSLFQKKANKYIEQILKNGKTPIICGGTGFYIDSLTKNFTLPEVKENKKLRKELANKSSIELFEILKKLDEKRAKDIKDKNEINNKVRLIRAIEIAEALGNVPRIEEKESKYNFVKIGLRVPKEELKKKISKRVKKMFQNGLLEEIKNLKKLGIKDKRLKEFGFEYWNPDEKSVITESIKYAKRQETWFKKDKAIKWFDPKQKKEILNYLQNFF